MSRKAPVCAHVSTSTYTHVDVLEGSVHTQLHTCTSRATCTVPAAGCANVDHAGTCKHTRVRAAFWVHGVLLHVAVSMSEQCTRACPHRATIPAPPCRHHSPTPSLTTPSSAGALSPTTSITGQLEVRGKGTVRAGAGLCHPASPVLCQSDSYRRVLALGTVPGRLMSRSLRLAEKKERASVSP